MKVGFAACLLKPISGLGLPTDLDGLKDCEDDLDLSLNAEYWISIFE
jgi:hypothetical protein